MRKLLLPGEAMRGQLAKIMLAAMGWEEDSNKPTDGIAPTTPGRASRLSA
jgi:hypothetical protein